MTHMQHSEEPQPKRHKPTDDNSFKVGADSSMIGKHSQKRLTQPKKISGCLSLQEEFHTDEVPSAAEIPCNGHQLSIVAQSQAQSHEAPAAACTPEDTAGPLHGEVPHAS